MWAWTRQAGHSFRRRKIGRRLLRGAIVALLLVIALPTAFIGANCYPTGQTNRSPAAHAPHSDMAAYQRAEAFTYLTLPEWFTVYSADEYARFTDHGSPSDFPYFRSIAQYWGFYSSACRVTRSAYPFETGYHVLLGVIGATFTVEYAIKGIYENTIGRVTAWFGRDTPEDQFAARTAADYAKFIREVPWYDFSFAARLVRLWSEVPVWGPQPVRKLERRLALSLEYSVKAVYCAAIGIAAQSMYGPEDLKIQAHVADASKAIFQDPRVEKIRDAPDGTFVVRLPRYEAFTRTALALLDAHVRFLDVAGNDEILVTVVAPASFDERAIRGNDVIATQAIPTDPDHKRVALRVLVANLHEVVPAVRSAGGTIEHLYDYR